MTKTPTPRPLAIRRRSLLLAGAAALAAPGVRAQQGAFTLGLLSQADDERYAPQVLQKAWPDAPAGRCAAAAQIGLNDSIFNLRMAGWSTARLAAVQAPDAAGLPAALEQLRQQGAHHIVLELPAPSVAAVTQATRGQDLILLNAAAPQDALRAAQCAPHLLHTLPSHAMQMDAIVQLLVARKWKNPLVLHGSDAADQALLAAWRRSARRFGARPAAERAFKLSNDPRERDLGNVRLLTSGLDYDAVVVLDGEGEFARSVPFRAVLPRPVLGSNGLTAQAWSPFHERHGAPQLTRRFLRKAGRAMGSYDWAGWIAARAAAEVAAAHRRASIAQQLDALRQGVIALDGSKGQRLTFRAWDGQLRQPLLLAFGNGVADVAPLPGFLHPRTVLDTLGYDAPETGCKPR